MRKVIRGGAVIAIVLIGWGGVQACGPEFLILLPQRHAELRAPIPFALAEELASLQVPWLLDEATRRVLAQQAPAQTPYDPYQSPEDRQKRQATAQQQGADKALPAVIALYAAAASEFRQQHPTAARAHFEQLLALPAIQAAPRATWAAYSLGRLLAPDDSLAAAAAFARTRAAAAAGAPDPLGLALDSLGEEAALWLHQGHEDGHLKALRLYVEQARLGSRSGLDSLRQLQTLVDAQPGLQARLMALDWGQALLLRLALSDDDVTASKPRYRRAVQALELAAPVALHEPERWAALAWQQGDLPRAEIWVAGAPEASGIAAWVRAKLALAGGRPAEAARWYGVALKSMKTGDLQARLGIEIGLLQVQRGEFLQALAQFVRSGDAYWLDTAYLAEQVLRSDELKSWIDAQQAGPRLRHLLARRLMREGRFDAALPYFPATYTREFWGAEGVQKRLLDLPALAHHYAATVQSAASGHTRIGRARALMHAGHIAREYGMELMGFELAPDDFESHGAFDFGEYPRSTDGPLGRDEAQRLATVPATLALAAHADSQLPRFHYRYVAAQHAQQAAALLPPRSQAAAASLCHAALWVGPRDVAFTATVYQRYVATGGLMDWAPQFGQRCPEPAWWDAALTQTRQAVWVQAPWLKRHPWRSGAALFAMSALGLLWLLRRRLRLGDTLPRV